MVWDSNRIAPKSWEDIIAFYRNLEALNKDFTQLLELAHHIAASPYAQQIAGATSGTALLVVRGVSLGASLAHESNVDDAGAVDWGRKALRADIDLSGAVALVGPVALAAKEKAARPEGKNVVKAFEGLLRRLQWIA